MKLTKNFTSTELQCPCCGVCDMDGVFLAELQRLRDVIGRPFIISSGYRCEKHNKALSGAKNSKHLTGEAVDIYTSDWSSKDLHDLIDEISSNLASGLGLYPSHIHFDLREKRAAWVGRY